MGWHSFYRSRLGPLAVEGPRTFLGRSQISSMYCWAATGAQQQELESMLGEALNHFISDTRERAAAVLPGRGPPCGAEQVRFCLQPSALRMLIN